MRVTRQTHKSKLRKFIVVGLAVALLAIVLFFFLHRSQTAPSTTLDKNATISNKSSKTDVATPHTSDDVDVTKNTSQVPIATDTSIAITSLTQQNGQVSYVATISGEGSGTCAALFTHTASKPVENTTSASGVSCSGSIPDVEFDILGTWTLTLRYYTDNHQTVATKDIVIR